MAGASAAGRAQTLFLYVRAAGWPRVAPAVNVPLFFASKSHCKSQCKCFHCPRLQQRAAAHSHSFRHALVLLSLHAPTPHTPAPSHITHLHIITMVAFACLSFLSTVVLSLSLSTLAVAGAHEPPRRRHAGTNFIARNHTLSKRFDNARFSYYEAGQGACGAVNSDSDYVSLSHNLICNLSGADAPARSLP